jgi:hypothetical protein
MLAQSRRLLGGTTISDLLLLPWLIEIDHPLIVAMLVGTLVAFWASPSFRD